MILIFDGETSSKSMLLLMRRHLIFRFFSFSASYVFIVTTK